MRFVGVREEEEEEELLFLLVEDILGMCGGS